MVNFDGEWETVDDEEDRKAILAAKDGGAAAAPQDFETVKATVMKMPTKSKVRLVNYMKNLFRNWKIILLFAIIIIVFYFTIKKLKLCNI